LGDLGELTVKRMFGGLGLYRAGVFFAIVDDDIVYLRVDDETRPDFVARGMTPFRPMRNDPSRVSDNYYQCPADILDDCEELVIWARRAVRAASSPTAAVIKRARSAHEAKPRNGPRARATPSARSTKRKPAPKRAREPGR
jgi:DNA transformation protein